MTRESERPWLIFSFCLTVACLLALVLALACGVGASVPLGSCSRLGLGRLTQFLA